MALVVAGLALGGCASTPVVMPAEYTPPPVKPRAVAQLPGSKARRAAALAAALPVCKLRLGQVQDLRSDKMSLGEIGGRPITATDTLAWTRSGLTTLDTDAKIELVGSGEQLSLDADIVKAYVYSITSNKTAHIVLRVRYTNADAPVAEKVYRGADNTGNWASGEGEARNALNRALASAISQIRTDVLRHCADGHTDE